MNIFTVAFVPDCTVTTYNNGIGFVKGPECQVYYMVSNISLGESVVTKLTYQFLCVDQLSCLIISPFLFSASRVLNLKVSTMKAMSRMISTDGTCYVVLMAWRGMKIT